jgi:hypothetical protein
MLDTTIIVPVKVHDPRANALLDMHRDGIRISVFIEELLSTPLILSA